MEFEEFNYYGLYRTPLKQAMRRPTHDPPDIDITGIIEHPIHTEFFEHIKDRIPDQVLRCEFLDLWSDRMALKEYHHWVLCGRAAISCGDGEREKFYEDLVNTILVDFFVVWDEYKVKHEKVFGRKLGRHPSERYKNKTFRFRHENGVPVNFQVIRLDASWSQSFSSRPSSTHILSDGSRTSDTNNQHPSQIDSDRASNHCASNSDTNIPATSPRSKSSKNCCAIL